MPTRRKVRERGRELLERQRQSSGCNFQDFLKCVKAGIISWKATRRLYSKNVGLLTPEEGISSSRPLFHKRPNVQRKENLRRSFGYKHFPLPSSGGSDEYYRSSRSSSSSASPTVTRHQPLPSNPLNSIISIERALKIFSKWLLDNLLARCQKCHPAFSLKGGQALRQGKERRGI